MLAIAGHGHNSAAYGQTLEDEHAAYFGGGDPVPFNHMDLHLGDYITGTIGMSAEEEGIYIRFLARLYKAGKPFEDSDRDMAHFLSLDIRVWRRIKDKLVAHGKLIIRAGSLTNLRFEKERKKRAEFLQKSAEAARKRWEKREAKQEASGELPPNFPEKFRESVPELNTTLGHEANKNNDLKIKTDMLPIPIPIPLKKEERERSCPAEPDEAPPDLYVNGTCVRGRTFGTLLYESVEAVARSIGVPEETSREIAIANARQWEANGTKVRDPLAKITAALKAHKQPPPKPKKTGKREYSENFEKWWALYPRKEAKGDAFDAWENLGSVETHRKAYKALKEQLPELTARHNDPRGDYCKLPAGWLRDGRFDDDPPSAHSTHQAPSNVPIREADYPEEAWQAKLKRYLDKGKITQEEAVSAGLRL